MGLPPIDFRVPDGAWLKSDLARKIAALPWLSSLTARFGSLSTPGSASALAWPYKVAVVAVMLLVASGTLVTFGSAGAETPSSNTVEVLPGSDEASPNVEGQVLPGLVPGQSLLSADDLLSTLNLNDFTPIDAEALADDDDDDADAAEASRNQLAKASTTPTASPTTTAPTSTAPTTSAPTSSAPTTSAPTTTAPPPPEPSPTPSPTPTPDPRCSNVVWKLANSSKC